MKILVVTQYFYQENFRINQLCLDLKERGHEITILTGKPNYPMGEYYEGYSFKGKEDELWNDIPIIRVPLRARKKGSINLMLNYLSFIYYANKKAKKLNGNFDLIYVFEVSPITVALPAIKLKKRLCIPVIMNVQDLWPENIIAVTGITNKLIIGCVNKLVNYIYKNCDLLLATSPSFVQRIQNRLSNPEKVKYWPQYSVVTKEYEKTNILDSERLNIVFTGNIGEAQGIDLAIEAANILKDEPIHWHFIGDGRKKSQLVDLSKKYHLDSIVTFHGFKPENEIPKYLACADVALLILKPDPVFEMTIPAKLQTYLSCGVPILGCVSGEGKRVILDANAGLVSDEISVSALVEVCKKFISLNNEQRNVFSENALSYGNRYFNREKLLIELENYMEVMRNE